MDKDKEVMQALKIRALESQNKKLKRRIATTIRYIERASACGQAYGCEDILDVVVGLLNGDIK